MPLGQVPGRRRVRRLASTNQDTWVLPGVQRVLPGLRAVLPDLRRVLPDQCGVLPSVRHCTQFRTPRYFRVYGACSRKYPAVHNSGHRGSSGCTRLAPGSTPLYTIQDTGVLPGMRGVLPGVRRVHNSVPSALSDLRGVLRDVPHCTHFRTPGFFRVYAVYCRVYRLFFRMSTADSSAYAACFQVFAVCLRGEAPVLPALHGYASEGMRCSFVCLRCDSCPECASVST